MGCIRLWPTFDLAKHSTLISLWLYITFNSKECSPWGPFHFDEPLTFWLWQPLGRMTFRLLGDFNSDYHSTLKRLRVTYTLYFKSLAVPLTYALNFATPPLSMTSTSMTHKWMIYVSKWSFEFWENAYIYLQGLGNHNKSVGARYCTI